MRAGFSTLGPSVIVPGHRPPRYYRSLGSWQRACFVAIHNALARELVFGPILDQDLQEEGETAFFRSIRLQNGTYKTTRSRRLDDLNVLLLGLLPSARPLKLMNVAVSSGIPTLELLQAMEAADIQCDITAGDKSLTAFLITLGSRLSVLLDRDGNALQFDMFHHAIPNPPGGRNMLRYWPMLFLLKIASGLIYDCVVRPDPTRLLCWHRFGMCCRSLALVSPRLKSSRGLTLIGDDILANWQIHCEFHVIRAANILNKSYFDGRTLDRIVLNLRSRLLPQGLLVVCRTKDDGTNQITIFRASATGFELVARLGGGSEIEANILDIGRKETVEWQSERKASCPSKNEGSTTRRVLEFLVT